MDPATIAAALAALAPVITATVEALTRGGDWRQAAREALDSADAADHGLAAPRADEIEARHRARFPNGSSADILAHAADTATLQPLTQSRALTTKQRAALMRMLQMQVP